MNNPKEEAKRLVERFWESPKEWHFSNSNLESRTARQCALICVEEMVESATVYSDDPLLIEESEIKMQHLQQVKKEIEAL